MKRIVLIAAVILFAVSAFWLLKRNGDQEAVAPDDRGERFASEPSDQTNDGEATAVEPNFTPVDTSKLMALPYPYVLENAFPQLSFGNQRPLQVLSAPGDGEHLFVLCQEGRIHVFANDPAASEMKTFLDLRDRVSRRGNEEGLLGIAFHPDYQANGRFFVCYSAENDDREPSLVLSSFQREDGSSLTASPQSEEQILVVPQPFRTQNGGSLEFGPDGFLYVGLGDGGSANDPQDHGQNLKTLLGSVLRIDVDNRQGDLAYAIPADNPFVDSSDGARGEIWAYGFRNVWRLAFDRETGELWCGDVGQERFEEVDLVVKGGNYGWNKREGNHVFRAEDAYRFPLTDQDIETENAKYVAPVATYYHSDGRAVVGGRVYRGSRLPELQGQYIYADFFSGFIWGLQRDGGKVEDHWVCNTTQQIAGFGEDASGELYLCAFDGCLYRLAANSDYLDGSKRRFPFLLSETGLFESMDDLTPVAGARPYSVNVPLWSDGAHKERLIALPKGGQITFSDKGIWELPVGTVVLKHFFLEIKPGDPSTRKRLETRLLVNGPLGWDGYTYIWNEEQTDASLMDMATTASYEIEAQDGSTRTQQWYFPSRADCKACHTHAGGFVLSVNTRQLNRSHGSGNDGLNQLTAWEQAGMFKQKLPAQPSELDAYPDWEREEGAVESLARAYLDVNCSFCHTPGGPGNSPIDLAYHTPLERAVLIDVPPRGTRTGGPPATALLTPNRPGDSELIRRMEMRGPGQMPIIASFVPDEKAVRIVSEWIGRMNPSR